MRQFPLIMVARRIINHLLRLLLMESELTEEINHYIELNRIPDHLIDTLVKGVN